GAIPASSRWWWSRPPTAFGDYRITRDELGTRAPADCRRRRRWRAAHDRARPLGPDNADRAPARLVDGGDRTCRTHRWHRPRRLDPADRLHRLAWRRGGRDPVRSNRRYRRQRRSRAVRGLDRTLGVARASGWGTRPCPRARPCGRASP